MTRPFALEDATILTLPTEQDAFLIAAFAAVRRLPVTLGTMHGRGTNFTLTETSSFAVSRQPRLPLQAPDQPASFQPLAAFARSVTDVP